jgi:hypothetical protein
MHLLVLTATTASSVATSARPVDTNGWGSVTFLSTCDNATFNAFVQPLALMTKFSYTVSACVCVGAVSWQGKGEWMTLMTKFSYTVSD